MHFLDLNSLGLNELMPNMKIKIIGIFIFIAVACLLIFLRKEVLISKNYSLQSLMQRRIVDLKRDLRRLPKGHQLERFNILGELGFSALILNRHEESESYYLEAREVLKNLQLTKYELVENAQPFYLDMALNYLKWADKDNAKEKKIQKATALLYEYLGLDHDNLTAYWLLNLCYLKLERYDELEEKYKVLFPGLGAQGSLSLFKNIAPKLKVDVLGYLGGIVIEDFDNDGFLDIMVSDYDAGAQLRYFHNNGNGSFTDKTQEAHLTGVVGGRNLVQADYDNDGFIDVFVVRGVGYDGSNLLLHNNGDGTFSDVTFEAAPSGMGSFSMVAAWSDFDNDGDLDLFVGNAVGRITDTLLSYRYHNESKSKKEISFENYLFLNDGKGHFKNIAKQAGVDRTFYLYGASWGDFNNDRFSDLYVSTYNGNNLLFRNNRDGTFTDVSEVFGPTKPWTGSSAWFWDYNNDGNLDIFASQNHLDENITVKSYTSPPYAEQFLPALYEGSKDGRFRNVAPKKGFQVASSSPGSNFADLDNDGYPDIFLGNLGLFVYGLSVNRIYHNRQGESFDVAGNWIGADIIHQDIGGVAFGDLDNDGDQDIYLNTGGVIWQDNDVLLENPGFGNNWIKIRLVGKVSNRSAIGARIRADIIEGNQKRSVYAYVDSGGKCGSNSLQQHLGLGKAVNVDTLEIYWPTSNTTQVFHNVPANVSLKIVEGEDKYSVIELPAVNNSR